MHTNFSLAPFSLDKAAEFFALTDRNRTYLKEFLPWLDHTTCVNDSRKFIAQNIASDILIHAKGTTLNYFIEQNANIIGTIGLRDISKDNALIGYWLAKSHSGQGITTSATKELIAIAKAKQLTKTIILRCNPHNIGSRKIAEKCGFAFVEVLPKVENLYGTACDLNVYRLDL